MRAAHPGWSVLALRTAVAAAFEVATDVCKNGMFAFSFGVVPAKVNIKLTASLAATFVFSAVLSFGLLVLGVALAAGRG